MRKLFLFVPVALMLLIAVNGQAQELKRHERTIGAGLLQVSLNRDIPLYKDVTSKKPFDKIIFSVVREGNNKGEFEIKTSNPLLFKPYSFYEGDSEDEGAEHINTGLVNFAPTLIFRVLERFESKKHSGYSVVLNEDTFEKVFIRDNKHNKLYLEGKAHWDMSHNSSKDESTPTTPFAD